MCSSRAARPEIDYLGGKGQNATTFYQGNGGVPVGGLCRKLLWAIRFQDVNVLLNENLKVRQPGAVQ